MIEVRNDLTVAKVARSRSDMCDQTPLEFFSSHFYFIALCANIGWKNDDYRLSDPKRYYLIKMETTPSQKFSGGTMMRVIGAASDGSINEHVGIIVPIKTIVNGIGQRRIIDDVVRIMPEALSLQLFAAPRRLR